VPTFLKWSAYLLPGLVVVLSLSLSAVIALRHYQDARRNFSPEPPEAILAHPEATGIEGIQDASFTSSDHTLIAAWYAPSHNGAAVLLVHGTSADRSSLLVEMKSLAAAGFGVLAYDGPGYGLSGGKVCWGDDATSALSAAIGWLSARPELEPGRIGALGLSMGGYVLTQFAAQDQRLQSLVLEAVPPDMIETMRWQHRKWGFLSEQPALWALRHSAMPLDHPSPQDLIATIAPRPLLLIGGDQDQTVPLFMTRQLFDLAIEPKSLWIVAGAGHGRYAEVAPDEYSVRLTAFFTQTLLHGITPIDARKVHT